MKQKYKIFEGQTLQESVDKAHGEGFKILNLKEVWDLREEELIPFQYYDVATVFSKGIVRDVTLKELKDLKSFYDKRGRLLCLGLDDFSTLSGNYILSDDSRFVGVRINKVKKE